MNTPLCPHCGNPVTQISDNSNRESWGSSVVWNEAWHRAPPICAACGYEFTSSMEVKTGHASPLENTESEIKIQTGVSCAWPFIDMLDYQPFIEIEIKRSIPGESGGLSKQERIVLTPEEWQAIAAKLQSSLVPLVQQKSWWIDTT